MAFLHLFGPSSLFHSLLLFIQNISKVILHRMADPLSILASLLGVATAGIQSTRSLKEAAARYKTRDATLRRLISDVGDTENILNALKQLLEAATPQTVLDRDISMTTLLVGPIERCSEVCDKFEEAMEQFSRKSKTDVLDWAKMEFMRGDINQFLETVAGYKATISVGLGVLTMYVFHVSIHFISAPQTLCGPSYDADRSVKAHSQAISSSTRTV